MTAGPFDALGHDAGALAVTHLAGEAVGGGTAVAEADRHVGEIETPRTRRAAAGRHVDTACRADVDAGPGRGPLGLRGTEVHRAHGAGHARARNRLGRGSVEGARASDLVASRGRTVDSAIAAHGRTRVTISRLAGVGRAGVPADAGVRASAGIGAHARVGSRARVGHHARVGSHSRVGPHTRVDAAASVAAAARHQGQSSYANTNKARRSHHFTSKLAGRGFARPLYRSVDPMREAVKRSAEVRSSGRPVGSAHLRRTAASGSAWRGPPAPRRSTCRGRPRAERSSSCRGPASPS
ncbi:MAG: hypothetical protein DRJ42_21520 [Deltaproteobacteria bacterium]|nr:MAG: hypothetical protein DRJ42_21520 [Deltaproteobacteria bacterium]